MRTWRSSGHCTSVQQADSDLNSGEGQGCGDIAALDHRPYVAEHQRLNAVSRQMMISSSIMLVAGIVLKAATVMPLTMVPFYGVSHSKYLGGMLDSVDKSWWNLVP